MKKIGEIVLFETEKNDTFNLSKTKFFCESDLSKLEEICEGDLIEWRKWAKHDYG